MDKKFESKGDKTEISEFDNKTETAINFQGKKSNQNQEKADNRSQNSSDNK